MAARGHPAETITGHKRPVMITNTGQTVEALPEEESAWPPIQANCEQAGHEDRPSAYLLKTLFPDAPPARCDERQRSKHFRAEQCQRFVDRRPACR